MRHSISDVAFYLPLAMAICFVSAGCQSGLNGQSIPSPSYMQDDIEYFPTSAEFKLPAEAAALRAARQDEMAKRQ